MYTKPMLLAFAVLVIGMAYALTLPPRAPEPVDYVVQMGCPPGDPGWRTCFALCTQATGKDGAAYVQNCDYSCTAHACTRPAGRVFIRGDGDNDKPCEWASKPGEVLACRKAGAPTTPTQQLSTNQGVNR